MCNATALTDTVRVSQSRHVRRASGQTRGSEPVQKSRTTLPGWHAACRDATALFTGRQAVSTANSQSEHTLQRVPAR